MDLSAFAINEGTTSTIMKNDEKKDSEMVEQTANEVKESQKNSSNDAETKESKPTGVVRIQFNIKG